MQENGQEETRLGLTLPAPLPLSLSRGDRLGVLPGQLHPCEATAYGPLTNDPQPLGIGQLPMVEPERLLIDVAEQVEGLSADVGSCQAALEQAPEVLHPVSVDGAPDVFFGVVDDLVGIVGSQPVIAI